MLRPLMEMNISSHYNKINVKMSQMLIRFNSELYYFIMLEIIYS